MTRRIIRKINNFYISIYMLISVLLPIKKKVCSDNSNYILSFTSYGSRISKSWMTVKTILRQKNFTPYKIIIWIATDDKKYVTNRLRKLCKYGLEIRYCDDYKSYKKIIGTAKQYPDYKIITVDDDILYPQGHFQKLLEASSLYPNCVCCYLAHKITFKGQEVDKYLNWVNGSPGEKGPSYLLVPIGCNGILYPAGYFEDADLDYNSIKEIAPSADDLWLKFIGLKKYIPSVKVDSNYVFVPNIPGTLYNGMFAENSTKNDVAINKLQEYFSVSLNDYVYKDMELLDLQ